MRDVTLAFSDRFLFARTADRVIGVMGVMVQPGGTGLVFPPEIETCADPDGATRLLIHGALQRLRDGGARFAQLVLTSGEFARAAPFEAAGFVHVTSGAMLELRLEGFVGVPLGGPRATARDADPEVDAPLLTRLLGEINQGSLDCPELDAYRTPELVLEGHRATAGGRPAKWRVYAVDGDPAGMSVTIDSGDGDGWELIFFGIIPKHRGQGMGRAIVSDAARQTGAEATILRAACDVANHYASAIYENLGFQKTGLAGIWIHSLARAV